MRCLLLAQTAMGDTVSQTSAIRYFKEQGYDVVFYVFNNAYDILCKIPDADIRLLKETSMQEVKDEYKNGDIIAIGGWYWVEQRFFNFEADIVYPLNRLNGLPPMTMDDENKYLMENERNGTPLNWSDIHLNRMGIQNYKDYRPILGFEKINMNLGEKTVIINTGSREAARRMSLDLVKRVYFGLIASGYNVIVFNDNKQQSGWLIENKMVVKNVSILELANMIEQCLIFISPDTGPLHMAFALSHPMVALESSKPMNKVLEPYECLEIVTPMDRKAECSNKRNERCAGKECVITEFSSTCFTNCEHEPIIEAVKRLERRLKT